MNAPERESAVRTAGTAAGAFTRYEGATGEHIFELQRAAQTARRRRKREPVSRKKKLPDLEKRTAPDDPGLREPNKASSLATSSVDITCPKCRHMIRVAASERGKPVLCEKCATPFLIPTKDLAALRPLGR